VNWSAKEKDETITTNTKATSNKSRDLKLTAQFRHLQNNLPLFFTVDAFRSNNLSPHPLTLDDISADDAQLCDIFEPVFRGVHGNPLLPLFISQERNNYAKLCLPSDDMHQFLTISKPQFTNFNFRVSKFPNPSFIWMSFSLISTCRNTLY